MSKNKERNLIIVLLALLILVVLISMLTGRYKVSLNDFINLLKGENTDKVISLVIFNLRLSRTLLTLISGFGLAVVGYIFQSIFKNILASPDLIGVSSGASLGAAIAIVFFSGGMLAVRVSAFIFALIAVFLVLLLIRISSASTTTFILAGIIINSFTQGVVMFLKYFADPERDLPAIEYWSMGSFSSSTMEKLIWTAPMFLIGIIILFLLRWRILVLSSSSSEVKSLGVSLEKTRYIIIIFSTLIVASIISTSGLIAFVGLIAPHISRIIYKRMNSYSIIYSGIIGSILLIIADILARSVSSAEIPISIWTTFIGAPFLAYLIIKRRHIN